MFMLTRRWVYFLNKNKQLSRGFQKVIYIINKLKFNEINVVSLGHTNVKNILIITKITLKLIFFLEINKWNRKENTVRLH